MTICLIYDPEDGSGTMSSCVHSFAAAQAALDTWEQYAKSEALRLAQIIPDDEPELTENEAREIEQDSHLHN